MSTKIGRIAVAAGVLTAAILVPATAAQATPRNCTDRYDDRSYSAYCGKGSGQFRAAVRCYRVGHSTYTVRYGEWELVDHSRNSVATCLVGEEPATGRIQTR